MITVTFTTLDNEKVYFARLPDGFTRLDLIHAVPKLDNLSKYRLLIMDQVLCLDRDDIFDRQRHLIHPFVEITILNQAAGGTFLDISLLKDILLEDLKTEWTNVDRSLNTCDFCLCPDLCATIHRTNVCIDCFPNYLKETNFQLRCKKQIVDRNDLQRVKHQQSPFSDDHLLCKPECPFPLNLDARQIEKATDQIVMFCEGTVDYHTFFKTEDFIDRWSILCEISDLLKNIDCQICYCGTVLFNMTMFAKQQCSNCHRWLCFFCNRTWNGQTMKNQMYTCTDDCEYERRLQYDLVPLFRVAKILIPDRRCCPNCFIVGGYGNACKYHSCPYCRYQFCFICLETDVDCKEKHHSSAFEPCTNVKKQDYSMFPRIQDS